MEICPIPQPFDSVNLNAIVQDARHAVALEVGRTRADRVYRRAVRSTSGSAVRTKVRIFLRSAFVGLDAPLVHLGFVAPVVRSRSVRFVPLSVTPTTAPPSLSLSLPLSHPSIRPTSFPPL